MRTTTAVLVGAVLFTLPFQLYLHGGSHHDGRDAPHTDHDARHGGTLIMVDDHHLEVVAADGRVEVYVTDALRRPVQPSGGSALFDDGTATTFAWQSYRLVAETPRGFVWADYEIRLEDGAVLAIRVPAPDGEAQRVRDPA